eukprot:103276_1
MADFVVGIDYLLEGSDDDSSDEELQPPSEAKQEPPKQLKQEPPKQLKQEPPKEPELTGMELLRSMYKKDEELIQRSRSYTDDSSHSKHKHIKVKLKIGTCVDIFSASKKQWLEGSVIEIKGDTICILYGKRKKWLHKKSKNWRPKQQMVQKALHAPKERMARAQTFSNAPAQPNQLPVSDSPPASFSAVYLDDDTMTPSLSPQPPPKKDPVPIDDLDDFCAFDGDLAPPPPFGPPPQEEAPAAFSMPQQIPDDAIRPRQMSQASPNHYEYDVVFVTQQLGLSLCAFKDGSNCIVKQCMNAFSASSVDQGSLVTSVNGKHVYGMSYHIIRDILKNNAKQPPMTVTFRARMDEKNYQQEDNVNERGLLQLKIVSCIELKHAANYVGIRVGGAFLTTKELKKNNHHPEWDEVMSFKNFRCDHGKKATITVFQKSAVLKDKKVGSVEYTLPVKFGKLKKETLELTTEKGKISGILNLNSIVVPVSGFGY